MRVSMVLLSWTTKALLFLFLAYLLCCENPSNTSKLPILMYSWQGCGMHVTCALMGVADEDRCVNWKHGVYKPCEVKGENKASE